MDVVPAGRTVWARSLAREWMGRKFDFQHVRAMQFDKAAVPVLTGHGEFKTVTADQPRPPMASPSQSQPVERDAFVQQLHLAALAVLPDHAQWPVAQSEPAPDPGADACGQQHERYMAQIDHGDASTASTRICSGSG